MWVFDSLFHNSYANLESCVWCAVVTWIFRNEEHIPNLCKGSVRTIDHCERLEKLFYAYTSAYADQNEILKHFYLNFFPYSNETNRRKARFRGANELSQDTAWDQVPTNGIHDRIAEVHAANEASSEERKAKENQRKTEAKKNLTQETKRNGIKTSPYQE